MAYEKNVGAVADWSIFVSEKEVELFKSFCPHARTMVIPNGVDVEHYNDNKFSQLGRFSPFGQLNGDKGLNGLNGQNEQKGLNGQDGLQGVNRQNGLNGHNGPNILFIGAMDYFPNEDAVLYFYDEIWSYVKKELSTAKFFIVGGNPSKKVQSLPDKDPDVVVTGYVHDIRSYLRIADVFVAPLRVARGIQNKVLEAMAAGLPVVARPEAVQGLQYHNGCIEVEERSERFAKSLLKIVKVPNKGYQMVKDARRFIVENHDWEKNLRKFENIITGGNR
jgi:glycosyltransferase involved in cell wall biosynthesis